MTDGKGVAGVFDEERREALHQHVLEDLDKGGALFLAGLAPVTAEDEAADGADAEIQLNSRSVTSVPLW